LGGPRKILLVPLSRSAVAAHDSRHKRVYVEAIDDAVLVHVCQAVRFPTQNRRQKRVHIQTVDLAIVMQPSQDAQVATLLAQQPTDSGAIADSRQCEQPRNVFRRGLRKNSAAGATNHNGWPTQP
jgi:hypothetical protein